MQPSAYLHFLSLALHPYRPPLLEPTSVSRYIYIFYLLVYLRCLALTLSLAPWANRGMRIVGDTQSVSGLDEGSLSVIGDGGQG